MAGSAARICWEHSPGSQERGVPILAAVHVVGVCILEDDGASIRTASQLYCFGDTGKTCLCNPCSWKPEAATELGVGPHEAEWLGAECGLGQS